eukprot:1809434-Prymnesium_polylepis.1
MRMGLRERLKLVEIDVDDLANGRRHAVSATTTSSCGASLTMAAIFQLRPSTSPGKLGSLIFASLSGSSDRRSSRPMRCRPVPMTSATNRLRLGVR